MASQGQAMETSGRDCQAFGGIRGLHLYSPITHGTVWPVIRWKALRKQQGEKKKVIARFLKRLCVREEPTPVIVCACKRRPWLGKNFLQCEMQMGSSTCEQWSLLTSTEVLSSDFKINTNVSLFLFTNIILVFTEFSAKGQNKSW